MNEIEKDNTKYFYNYNEKGNETKRLTLILLIFAFILCPIFAFCFKYIGAPIVYFYCVLSATFVFPLILFIERFIPFFKQKLPVLFFLMF